MSPADLRAARAALSVKLGRRVSQKEMAQLLSMGKHGWQTLSKWEQDAFEGDIPGVYSVAVNCLLNHPVG